MKVMFVGNLQDEKDGSGGVTWYGVRFPLNLAIDVAHLKPEQRAKLAHNNHFKVVEAEVVPAPIPATALARPQPVTAQEPADATPAAPAPGPVDLPPPAPAPSAAPAARPAPRVVKANPKA